MGLSYEKNAVVVVPTLITLDKIIQEGCAKIDDEMRGLGRYR
jgi:hypothetical protein